LAQLYLSEWLGQLPQPIVIRAGNYLELRVPDPSQKVKLDAGKKEYFTSACASVGGIRGYYSLAVDSTPPGAQVWIDGKYLKGPTYAVRDSPVRILFRYPGCQDVAKTVSLEAGPNVVKVVFGGCRQ
jgi:hypothetical protein